MFTGLTASPLFKPLILFVCGILTDGAILFACGTALKEF